MDILDTYVTSGPTAQNVVDLFKNEWSSRFPVDSGVTSTPGFAGLFEDARITWATSVLGPFKGKAILELGPLEAAHTYMLQKAGAKSIVAVEANSKAFLKCLCVKEVLNLDKAKFLLGDFNSYMETTAEQFDVLFASGILYHMTDPVHTLKLISNRCEKVFLWTHYYDDVLRTSEQLKKKYGSVETASYDGWQYEYVTQSYLEALNSNAFCGGSAPTSKWLTRKSLLAALEQFGFKHSKIEFDHAKHPNGPALAVCAWK